MKLKRLNYLLPLETLITALDVCVCMCVYVCVCMCMCGLSSESITSQAYLNLRLNLLQSCFSVVYWS